MIGHEGSCSRLIPMLENVLKSNWMGSLEEAYRKIVIVTDRDDDNSETYLLNEMNWIFYGVGATQSMKIQPLNPRRESLQIMKWVSFVLLAQ